MVNRVENIKRDNKFYKIDKNSVIYINGDEIAVKC